MKKAALLLLTYYTLLAISAPLPSRNMVQVLEESDTTTTTTPPPETLLPPTPFCEDFAYEPCGRCCIAVAGDPPRIVEDVSGSADQFLYKFLRTMKCVPPVSLDVMAVCGGGV